MFYIYTISLHFTLYQNILYCLMLCYPLLRRHPSIHHLHTVHSHGRTAQEECKIITYGLRHLDIGLCDVLSYMLALVSFFVPLSSSVSTVLRGKLYINYTTHYITN